LAIGRLGSVPSSRSCTRMMSRWVESEREMEVDEVVQQLPIGSCGAATISDPPCSRTHWCRSGSPRASRPCSGSAGTARPADPDRGAEFADRDRVEARGLRRNRAAASRNSCLVRAFPCALAVVIR
jgi:hypothetical protein